MKITRQWAMPNKRTFKIKPIKMIINKWKKKFPSSIILDPFPYEYKKDATKFLSELPDNNYNFAVFDPPYSPRQLKECYKGIGEYDTKSSTWGNWKDLLGLKIKKNGLVLSFGWNSGGLGKKRGFEKEEILLVAHGGSHNDTIVVVERKIQCTLNNLKEK